MKKMIKKQLIWNILIPVLGGLFLTFSRQLLFLFSNQNQYFLYGLRLFDPNFIPQDWFTWQTFHHNFAFGYLIYLLQFLGSLNITSIIAEFIISTCLSLGVWLLVKKYTRYPVVIFFLILVWLRLVNGAEIGLGGQYLIGGYLQPSEIAGPLMILGIALLLTHNFFSSGIILGLAGLFHGAFLSSFGPGILITALLTGFWRKLKSFLLFTTPLLLFWGIFIFIVTRAFSYSIPMTDKIASIMINLRAPGDFIISNWSFKWTLNWLMWAIMGLITIYKLRNKKLYRTLIIFFLTILLTNIFGILQAIWLKIPTITLMMLWRSSSLITILSVLLAADYGIGLALGNKEKLKQNIILITIFFICSLVLIYTSWGPQLSRIHFLWLMAIPLAGISGWLVDQLNIGFITRKNAVFYVLFTIIFLIMMIYLKGYFGKYNNFLANPQPSTVASIEKWAREKTGKNAIFIIPPDMEFFRIRARRAIIIDWKTSLFLPADLNEWYQRLSDEAGFSSDLLIFDNQDIINGYRQLDYNRAVFLAKKYKASYVVIENKKHLGDITGLKEKYNNEDYQVLEIPIMREKI